MALLRREALLEIGGVATETIAEDFHTTIRLLRHGWSSHYHDEVLVQGLARHDLDGYLLQRDRWARGNLAVFTLPESPLRARELRPVQRLFYFVSLAAYLAPPMRLLLLATLGLVLWSGALPMKISVVALAALWLPAVSLNLLAGSALTRGYMKIGETAHYELLTLEIYTRALRCIFRPGRTAFKVTPKQGADGGGIAAVRKLHLVILAAVVLGGGTAMRLLDLAGVGLVFDAPVTVGEHPAVLLGLENVAGEAYEVTAQIEIRSCREVDGRYLVGATIEEMDAASRMRLMEWCYVVCSHERLRGHRPAGPAPISSEQIVMPLGAPVAQRVAAG